MSKSVELFSGRVKKVPSTQVSASRYQFLKLSEAEPDLGVPAEEGSMLISSTAGTRAWTNSIKVVGTDVIIGTNLIVNGTTVTVNTVETTLDDPVLTLGGDTPPTVNDGRDRGIEFRWFSTEDNEAKLGFFGFRNDNKAFTYIPDATVINGEYIGDLGFLEANISGTLSTNDIIAPPNQNITITTIGTGTVVINSVISEGVWQGQLIEVPYGGTGRDTITAKGVMFGNGTAAVGVTGAALADGSILQANLNGDPYFSNIIDCGSF
jgi:hypothetical protein